MLMDFISFSELIYFSVLEMRVYKYHFIAFLPGDFVCILLKSNILEKLFAEFSGTLSVSWTSSLSSSSSSEISNRFLKIIKTERENIWIIQSFQMCPDFTNF